MWAQGSWRAACLRCACFITCLDLHIVVSRHLRALDLHPGLPRGLARRQHQQVRPADGRGRERRLLRVNLLQTAAVKEGLGQQRPRCNRSGGGAEESKDDSTISSNPFRQAGARAGCGSRPEDLPVSGPNDAPRGSCCRAQPPAQPVVQQQHATAAVGLRSSAHHSCAVVKQQRCGEATAAAAVPALLPASPPSAWSPWAPGPRSPAGPPPPPTARWSRPGRPSW